MSLEAMNIIAVLLQYAGLIVLLRGVLGYPFRGKKFVAAACAGLGILLHLGDWMWSWQMVEIIPDYYVHIGAWLHMLASAMAEYALFSQLSVSAFVFFL